MNKITLMHQHQKSEYTEVSTPSMKSDNCHSADVLWPRVVKSRGWNTQAGLSLRLIDTT